LDGKSAGWVQSIEGGHASADIVIEKIGGGHIAKKHIAGVKYEDITITLGSLSEPMLDWIKATMNQTPVRKDGKLVAQDFNSMTVLKFSQALISEIGFPALDAGSKDAAKLTLKFSPDSTEYKHTVGHAVLQDAVVEKQQKKWMAANFRLRIEGLEESCARVNKIEAITIKQKIAENPVGENRDFSPEPAGLDYSDLKITLPEHNADQLVDWFQDFVIKGENSDDKEKKGSIEFLSPNLKETLFKLELVHTGIFKLKPDDFTSENDDKLRHVQAEMYCEEIKFPSLQPPKGT